MFSHEIKQFLAERDNIINKEDYYYLTDIRENPQIKSIKYNTFEDKYELETDDGYYFKFSVRRKRNDS